MPQKFIVVTTFNKQGYQQYGQRMISTFIKNWPAEVELRVYAEHCTVLETADNLTVVDLESSVPELVSFKTRWHGVPKANGDVSNDPLRSKRKDAGKGFKWDAVRFSHKVYSIFHAAKNTDADWLIWMDADMVCHGPIGLKFLTTMCPANKDICFLGREAKYTECGLYAINLKSNLGKMFLQRFQEYYDQDFIFEFAEWHDSYVFDKVRENVQCQEFNWSSGLILGEGHPLINSSWGSYLDHLKGDRKSLGHSKLKDLKVSRREPYWQHLASE
jgi:hypothetical protein